MFEHEHVRFVNMLAASEGGGLGRGSHRFVKDIMEHNDVQHLRAANGDKSPLRWDKSQVQMRGYLTGY